jgi:uncharacterized protein (UPF0332 family)
MKTRSVDRSKAKYYIKKAEECKNSMQRAFEANEWNSCVINAIHCAISSADAFCISKIGLRNASERHDNALVLFTSTNQTSEEVKNNAKHLSKLLDIKTDAEYGERLFYEKDAIEATKHAERLYNFVKSNIV